MPYAVTYDAADTNAYFAGFSQNFDTSVDGLTLFQATNVENVSTGRNDIRVGSIPLNASRYEAEKATLTHVQIGNMIDASGGQEVQYINYSDSSMNFTNVKVPTSGTYTINVRYSNGSGSTSSHSVSVNGGTAFTLNYPATTNWDRYLWASFTANLNAGNNTIKLAYNSGFAEVDAIDVFKAGQSLNDDFQIVNRNSGKLLEVTSNSAADGALVEQWGYTGFPCQLWSFSSTSSGYNKIVNRNSGKLLEVYQASTADGATVDQWGDTGFNGQQWTLVKEGSK